jgi:hypothetical protein
MASLAREAESCMWYERFFEDLLRAESLSDVGMDVTHTRYSTHDDVVRHIVKVHGKVYNGEELRNLLKIPSSIERGNYLSDLG